MRTIAMSLLFYAALQTAGAADCGPGLFDEAVPLGPQPEVAFHAASRDAWQPPPCSGWAPRRATVAVSVAGRFREPGGWPAILDRIRRVSALPTISYWSVTRQRWRPLVTEAWALQGPDRRLRRPDFEPAELLAGQPLYVYQHENTPAGAVVYRMELDRPARDLLRVRVENPVPVRILFWTLFEPGEYQSVYLIRRHGDHWDYRGLLRAGTGPNALVERYVASYVNRAAALYRYIAGIPTDTEPPVAPDPVGGSVWETAGPDED